MTTQNYSILRKPLRPSRPYFAIPDAQAHEDYSNGGFSTIPSPDSGPKVDHYSTANQDASETHLLSKEREIGRLEARSPRLPASVSIEELRTPFAAEHHHTKSWRAPILMLAGLTSAWIVALLHHLMNTKLNGQQVADVFARTGLSQGWIQSIATLMTFTVKTAFVLTVAAAFVQRQWFNLHRTPFTIKQLDNITSVLREPFSFLDKVLWTQLPLLALMAVISWTLPLLAIFPVGTLTIEAIATTEITTGQVPQLNYTAWNPVNPWVTSESQLNYERAPPFYPATSPTVYRKAYAVAASGQMLALSSQHPNQSYHLDFYAPSLQCGPASEDIVYNASTRYGALYGALGIVVSDTTGRVLFASWTDTSMFNSSSPVEPTGALDLSSNDTARIFFMSNEGNWLGSQTPPTLGPTLENPNHPIEGEIYNAMRVNVTECKLYNASYSVDFDFRYPSQVIMASATIQNPVSFGALPPIATASTDPITMDGFNQYSTYFDPVMVAYASIMQSFGLLFVGTWATDGTNADTATSKVALLENIDLTVGENVTKTMSDLFQNFTLSLLSVPLLSNATTTSPIALTVITYPTTYVYTPRSLVISYGIGLACALICCIVGIYTFFVNEGSYQNHFSTYLRALTEAGVQSLIDDGDLGADPLPKSLGQTKLYISGYKATDTLINNKKL